MLLSTERYVPGLGVTGAPCGVSAGVALACVANADRFTCPTILSGGENVGAGTTLDAVAAPAAA
jgi:hypothetical protein